MENPPLRIQNTVHQGARQRIIQLLKEHEEDAQKTEEIKVFNIQLSNEKIEEAIRKINGTESI